MTEDFTNRGRIDDPDRVASEHGLVAVEHRLRSDLPQLAEALLASDETQQFVGGVSRPHRRSSVRDWRFAAAAAVTLLLVGAGALWLLPDSGGQIEAALNDDEQTSVGDEDVSDTVDAIADDDPGWYTLPELNVVDLKPRAHMVSVWAGKDAIFWGGRTEVGDSVEAGAGGAAYNPASDAWIGIASPQWGHPEGAGVFHGRWLYVMTKGSVTRFDPGTGDEEELDVPTGAARGLFVLRDQVWVIVRVAGGLSAVPVEASGEVNDAAPLSPEPWPIVDSFNQSSATPDNLAVFDGDLYLTAQGLLFRVDGDTGEFQPLVGPDAVIEPGDLRVFAGETRLGVVSFDGQSMWAGTLEQADGREDVGWFEDPVEGVNPLTSTVVAAGDWITVLPNDDTPVSLHLVEWTRIDHDDSPLAGYAQPNAVWTGQELVVWGGQGEPAEPEGAVGARWVPPFVAPEEEAQEALPRTWVKVRAPSTPMLSAPSIAMDDRRRISD